jgi:YbbR domain-containing protein
VIWRLITNNLGWKLTSLALAFLLWIALAGKPVIVTTIAVPVQYRNLPRDLEISSDVVDRVRLEIRGPANRLNSASLADAAVLLDLSRVGRPGDHTFPIEQINAILPSDVVLVRSMPAQIRLTLERRMAREVPVHARISSPPPIGYEIETQDVDPPVLRIVGPESRVRDIHAVETDPIDLSGVVGRAEFQLYCYIPDPQVRFEETQRAKVTIVVRKTGQGEN